MSRTPPALKATTTAAAVVCPASTLRFEVPGSGWPSGHNLRNVVVVALVTVRLSTTAVAPLGMLAPVTCHTSTSWPGDRCIDRVFRLSSARTGVIGVNALCTAAPACATHD
jgi:hypothetical protein